MEGWNTTWLSMLNIILVDAQKSQEVVNSQGKLITIEEIFINIGKHMLETSYTLNLGQLLKIAPTSKKWPFCNWFLRLIFSCKGHLQLKS
jgi:hypothetical protein